MVTSLSVFSVLVKNNPFTAFFPIAYWRWRLLFGFFGIQPTLLAENAGAFKCKTSNGLRKNNEKSKQNKRKTKHDNDYSNWRVIGTYSTDGV